MELHPCECGKAGFEQRHWLEERGEDLLAIYEGPCLGCRRVRRFEIAMIDDLPPAPPAFGGPEPSRIIDPGEFLLASDRTMARVPDDLAALPTHLKNAAKRDLGCAIAALEEVLKFIPDGDDRVPPEAFRSQAGRQLFTSEPARFERRQLEHVIAEYRGRLNGHADARSRSSRP
jgi:hypothetical protein